MKKLFISILMIISLLFSLTVITVLIKKHIVLQQKCTGYLMRAANANTIELANTQLAIAIKYLEDNNLTSGYTSVLWKTPDEDIEFWYNNLKISQNELLKVDSTFSALEKTNILMKLRETLTDTNDGSDKLTYPFGLSRYPNNLLWGILLSISVILIVIIIIYLMMKL